MIINLFTLKQCLQFIVYFNKLQLTLVNSKFNFETIRIMLLSPRIMNTLIAEISNLSTRVRNLVGLSVIINQKCFLFTFKTKNSLQLKTRF